MFPYYFDKYGYTAGGTFSIKPRRQGRKALHPLNGAFVEHAAGKSSDTFGQCSVMVVNIPASERAE